MSENKPTQIIFNPVIWDGYRPKLKVTPEGKYEFLIKKIKKQGTGVHNWFQVVLEVVGTFAPKEKGSTVTWMINDAQVEDPIYGWLPNRTIADLGELFTQPGTQFPNLEYFITNFLIGHSFIGQLSYKKTMSKKGVEFENAMVWVDTKNRPQPQPHAPVQPVRQQPLNNGAPAQPWAGHQGDPHKAYQNPDPYDPNMDAKNAAAEPTTATPAEQPIAGFFTSEK